MLLGQNRRTSGEWRMNAFCGSPLAPKKEVAHQSDFPRNITSDSVESFSWPSRFNFIFSLQIIMVITIINNYYYNIVPIFGDKHCPRL